MKVCFSKEGVKRQWLHFTVSDRWKQCGEWNNCIHGLTPHLIVMQYTCINQQKIPHDNFSTIFVLDFSICKHDFAHVPFTFPSWKHVRLCSVTAFVMKLLFCNKGNSWFLLWQAFFFSPSPFFPFLFYGNWGLNQWDVFPQKRFVLIHYEGAGDSLPLLPSYWEVIAGLRSESMREWVWEGHREREREIFKLSEIRSHIFRSRSSLALRVSFWRQTRIVDFKATAWSIEGEMWSWPAGISLIFSLSDKYWMYFGREI